MQSSARVIASNSYSRSDEISTERERACVRRKLNHLSSDDTSTDSTTASRTGISKSISPVISRTTIAVETVCVHPEENAAAPTYAYLIGVRSCVGQNVARQVI